MKEAPAGTREGVPVEQLKERWVEGVERAQTHLAGAPSGDGDPSWGTLRGAGGRAGRQVALPVSTQTVTGGSIETTFRGAEERSALPLKAPQFKMQQVGRVTGRQGQSHPKCPQKGIDHQHCQGGDRKKWGRCQHRTS